MASSPCAITVTFAVRAEYKRNIKGFIHDRSASGATFFIEPEQVLEMNNELRSLAIDEKEEVERILGELSRRVGFMGKELVSDIEVLEELDGFYARAEYAYKLSSVKPSVNASGIVSFDCGRHPLIDRKKVVPITLSLGRDYRFLLISGPNTGGKTVTLKMVGLFCLMAMCGLFIPAKRAEVSVFREIYCDIGDSQSIEESLSTFSSHVTNIVEIVDNADKNSLVLIDELGEVPTRRGAGPRESGGFLSSPCGRDGRGYDALFRPEGICFRYGRHRKRLYGIRFRYVAPLIRHQNRPARVEQRPRYF